MSKTILIIEDDINILRGLKSNLSFEGFEVLSAGDGHEGLRLALEGAPDLILLDLMLPGINGYDICRKVKAQKPELPIIMLTARGQEVDKVVGLDLGADDYVTKPFSVPELMARIRAVLRRTHTRDKPMDTYAFGHVTLDFKKYEATVQGRQIKLSAREFALLKYLIEREGEVVHRHDVLDEIWGYESDYFFE